MKKKKDKTAVEVTAFYRAADSYFKTTPLRKLGEKASISLLKSEYTNLPMKSVLQC